ncbi:unnamed protein product [Euphydryas editha]|uniref:Transposase n=1 Tax=Euphydryas editha TaxID=104508 RepID=A0AAU9UR94_EUPED|nr:unnamed protein product [Euphydryas editha]
MGRKKSLTSEEIGKIKILCEEGYSLRKIAKRIGRSHQVISNFLDDRENYGKKFKGRTKFATTERERRAILREASNSTLTARQIAHNVGTKASVRTVQRIIRNFPHLKRLKMKRKPCLKEHHCTERLHFARNNMHWTKEWYKVIFSDEKKINLDGPDGYSCYFHDLRKNEIILSRRRNDAGSVMVWGAISYNGPIDLVVIQGRQNSRSYINLLKKEICKFSSATDDKSFIFQHDNASIHRAHDVRQWFQQNNINVLDWPSLSPDLNIIENVWGWLSRELYKNGKQYNNKQDLEKGIKKCWSKLPIKYIRSLYDSMPSRIFDLIQKKGKSLNY